MDKKRLIHTSLLTLTLLTLPSGCSHDISMSEEAIKHVLTVQICDEDIYTSRSNAPDELMISDINLLLFDEEGDLHEKVYIEDGMTDCRLRLNDDVSYSLFACANTGQIHADHISEMEELVHYLGSPDDYDVGIPMSAVIHDLNISRDTTVRLALTRLAAKIALMIDRSRLNEDVELTIREVSLRNCPAKAGLFKERPAAKMEDCFETGFTVENVSPLNSCGNDGKSGEVCLFVLEDIRRSSGMEGLLPYLEIKADYRSDSLYTLGQPLIYRSLVSDCTSSGKIERNCIYDIMLTPEDDGISEDDWKSDKTGLLSFVQEIRLAHDTLRFTYMGEKTALGGMVLPEHAYRKELEWYSSDPGITSVTADGIVSALSEGECDIVCRSTDGSGVEESCHVVSHFLPPFFRAFPEEGYVIGNIGDEIHLRCEVFPPYTPFDVGREYLEDDKADGIYDYVIDEDGHGVTLTLRKPGSGLIYMEAGDPVNQSVLYYIIVNGQDVDTSQ